MTTKQLIDMLKDAPQDLQVGVLLDVPDSGGGREYREIVGHKHTQIDKYGKPDIEFLRLVLWGDADSHVW